MLETIKIPEKHYMDVRAELYYNDSRLNCPGNPNNNSEFIKNNKKNIIKKKFIQIMFGTCEEIKSGLKANNYYSSVDERLFQDISSYKERIQRYRERIDQNEYPLKVFSNGYLSWIIYNDPKIILNIVDLDMNQLKKIERKHSHLVMADKFGILND